MSAGLDRNRSLDGSMASGDTRMPIFNKESEQCIYIYIYIYSYGSINNYDIIVIIL